MPLLRVKIGPVIPPDDMLDTCVETLVFDQAECGKDGFDKSGVSLSTPNYTLQVAFSTAAV
jgi:hypothetical protein